MVVTDKTGAAAHQLIELSRAAVKRARQAVAAAEELNHDRGARDTDLRAHAVRLEEVPGPNPLRS